MDWPRHRQPLRAEEWMGRADAKTTQIYAHYAADESNGTKFVERAFGRWS